MSYWRETPTCIMMGKTGDGQWVARVEIGSKQKIEITADKPLAAYAQVRNRLEKSYKRRKDSLERLARTMAKVQEKLWKAAHDMEQYDSQIRKAA